MNKEIKYLEDFINEGIDLMTEKLIKIKQYPMDKYSLYSIRELNQTVDKALLDRYKLILEEKYNYLN